MRPGLVLALAALALGVGACRSAKPLVTGTGPRLELSVQPASPSSLPQGSIVRVSAMAVPATELAWVSGTVKLFGAKVLTLKQDPADKAWKFKTMVPYGISVPKGSYELRAWGKTIAGQPLEGSLTYEVR